jgi:hypothetical protein
MIRESEPPRARPSPILSWAWDCASLLAGWVQASEICRTGAAQTGPTHGFHQCGIKPTGLDSVSPYISSLALHTLETLICLYMALLLVELMLT